MTYTKNTTWNQRLRSSGELKSTVKHIFKDAKKNHHTHKFILSRLKNSVYSQQKYISLTRYMRTEINGYIEANFDFMYEYLEFAHVYDGLHTVNLIYDAKFDQNLMSDSYHCYKGTQDKY